MQEVIWSGLVQCRISLGQLIVLALLLCDEQHDNVEHVCVIRPVSPVYTNAQTFTLEARQEGGNTGDSDSLPASSLGPARKTEQRSSLHPRGTKPRGKFPRSLC